MAKIINKLTCTADHIKVVNGIAIITFEREVDINDVDTAEASGEYQGNMLWECFGHSFVTIDDDGNEVQYNDEGDRI